MGLEMMKQMLNSLTNLMTWRLTWRFLLQLRCRRSSKLFATICVLGIALTVFVFFAVDAVVTGYQGHIRQTLLGFQSPLTLMATSEAEHRLQAKILHDWQKQQTQYPFQISEHREFYALLNMLDLTQPIGVKIRTLAADQVADLSVETQFYWNDGYDLQEFANSKSGVLLGASLFRKLPTEALDEELVELIHPFADIGPTGEFEPQSVSFEVAGLMKSGVHEIDEYYVLVSESALQQYATSAAFKWIWQIEPQNLNDTQALAKDWSHFADAQKPLISWFEKNKALVKLMQLEKIIIATLFVLLFLITTANLTSLTHIFGMTHLKSLMILKALGLSTVEIKAIFWQFGLIMGVIGTGLGLIAGVVFVCILATFPFHLPETYGFTQLPVVFPFATFWILGLLVPLFCVALSVWPARKLVQQSVVDILRKV